MVRLSDSDPKLLSYVREWYARAFGRGSYPEKEFGAFVDKGIFPLNAPSHHASKGLETIDHSDYPFPEAPFKPARAKLDDGTQIEAVLFAPEVVYFYLWDHAVPKDSISVARIVEVQPSAIQTPPQIARKIRSFGETGPDYVTFELVMKDGHRLPCWYGSSILDFVTLPLPYNSRDIDDVSLLRRKPDVSTDLRPPRFSWCIYRADAEMVKRVRSQIGDRLLDVDEYLRLRPEAAV